MSRPERPPLRRVIVVGAGVAGLMVTHELARRGQPVLLLAFAPAAHARSAAARGGLNAVLEPQLGGDDVALHLADTLRAGEYRAPTAAVRGMVEAAPDLVRQLDHGGVPFLRAPAGTLARFRHAGARAARTLLAGASTGRLVLGTLDDQVRRWEAAPAQDELGRRYPGESLVQRLERWDLVALVRDDNGVVVGVVAEDRRTLRAKAFPGDAVCLATGSMAGLFVPTPHAAVASGSGIAIAARAGAAMADPEALAFHPFTVRIRDGGLAVTEGLRAEGARCFVPRFADDDRSPASIPDRDREYLDPLDTAGGRTRQGAAHALLAKATRGERSRLAPALFLDLAGVEVERLATRLGPVLTAAGLATDADGRCLPLAVAPRVHDTLGGLWVDHEAAADSPRNHATSLPGLYAAGACQALYHGLGLLGGNDLLACLFGATRAAAAIVGYRSSLARSAEELPSSVFDRAAETADAARGALAARGEAGEESNHFALQRALTEHLAQAVISPEPDGLAAASEAVAAIGARARAAPVADRATGWNPSLEQARHLDHLLALAPVVLAARARSAATAADTPRRTLAFLADDGPRFVAELTYECVGRRITVTDALSVARDALAAAPTSGAPEPQPGDSR